MFYLRKNLYIYLLFNASLKKKTSYILDFSKITLNLVWQLKFRNRLLYIHYLLFVLKFTFGHLFIATDCEFFWVAVITKLVLDCRCYFLVVASVYTCFEI